MRGGLFVFWALFLLSCSTAPSVQFLRVDGDVERHNDEDPEPVAPDGDRREAEPESTQESEPYDSDSADPESESDSDPDPADSESEPESDPDSDSDPADPDPEEPNLWAQRCEYQVDARTTLNRGTAPCPSGTLCLGLYYDGQSPNNPNVLPCRGDSECTAELGALALCAGGYCGLAFCGVEAACTADTACAAIGEKACCLKQTGASSGQCLPYDLCQQAKSGSQPGEPCPFGDGVNAQAAACADGASCLGILYDGRNGRKDLNCTTTWDCAWLHHLTSELVQCSSSGFCGLSFCSVPAGEDCTALGGVGAKAGESAVCDALAGMNSPRWGKACCVVAGAQTLCLPASVCAQIGKAKPGEACKDPSYQINMDREFCQAGYFCASAIFGATRCETRADCAGFDALHADCLGHACATSFCTGPPCDGPDSCPAEIYGVGACCNIAAYDGQDAYCSPASFCNRPLP